jgi:hypothetical protein
MGETDDLAVRQRVEIDRPEDNWGGASCRDRGLQYGILAGGHNHVDAAASKLAHRRGQAVHVSILDEIDRQVATFDIAELAQPILKGDIRGVRA